MKVPDNIAWPALNKNQKDIVRMWVALGLDVEVRGIADDRWISIHAPSIKRHFLMYQNSIQWRIRLKP